MVIFVPKRCVWFGQGLHIYLLFAALAADFTVPHGAAFTVAAVGPTVAVVGPTVAADTGNRGSIRDSVIR